MTMDLAAFGTLCRASWNNSTEPEESPARAPSAATSARHLCRNFLWLCCVELRSALSQALDAPVPCNGTGLGLSRFSKLRHCSDPICLFPTQMRTSPARRTVRCRIPRTMPDCQTARPCSHFGCAGNMAGAQPPACLGAPAAAGIVMAESSEESGRV